MGDLSVLPHYFYIQLLIYSNMGLRYLFYTLCYNPVLLYCLAQIVPALAVGSSLSIVSWATGNISSQSFIFFFSTFLSPGISDAPGSSSLYTAPYLQSTILQGTFIGQGIRI